MKKHFGVGVLLAAVVAMSCANQIGFNLNNRNTFAELTYAGDGTPDPEVKSQLEFQLFAMLQMDVMGPWDSPPAVGDCLQHVGADQLITIARTMSTAPEALADAGVSSVTDVWAERVWLGLQKAGLSTACQAVLFPAHATDDSLQLAWALAHASQRISDFAHQTWMPSANPDSSRSVYVTGDRALKRLAVMILRTQPAPAPFHNNLPVLALAGGSANGAFSAGVLYELLSAREQALINLDIAIDDPRAKAARFSTVVGTSVGALLTELVDFSMLDPATLDDGQKQWLEQCNLEDPATEFIKEQPFVPQADETCGCDEFSRWPARAFPIEKVITRPVTNCALRKLAHYFADTNEGELMCAEPGSVGRVIGFGGRKRPNFMRFDPMQAKPVDVLLEKFGLSMSKNGINRVVAAVETQQSQLVGLDERACSTTISRKNIECRGSGVMASLVLPLFARPVTRVSSGFSEKGECGVWFDGGLRSTLSSMRALMNSRPNTLIDGHDPLPTDGSSAATACRDNLLCEHDRLRVLAIDNGRLTTLPDKRSKVITDVMFNGLGQFTNQQAPAELALAQAIAQQREAEFGALSKTVPHLVTVGASERGKQSLRDQLHTMSPAATEARVHALHVPAEVPSWIVFGAGYSFDPYVMRGLFVWGRKVMREQILAQRLIERLGWPHEVRKEMVRLVAARRGTDGLDEWIDAYSKPVCPAFRKERFVEGKKRITEQMPLCPEPERGPQYLSCGTGIDIGSGADAPMVTP